MEIRDITGISWVILRRCSKSSWLRVILVGANGVMQSAARALVELPTFGGKKCLYGCSPRKMIHGTRQLWWSDKGTVKKFDNRNVGGIGEVVMVLSLVTVNIIVVIKNTSDELGSKVTTTRKEP